jgi:hypothetical protein
MAKQKFKILSFLTDMAKMLLAGPIYFYVIRIFGPLKIIEPTNLTGPEVFLITKFDCIV